MTSSKKRLAVAAACGLIAALLLGLYANDLRTQASSSRSQALADYGGEQVEILVATRDIAAGEILDESNVTYRTWLVDLLPAGVARDITEVTGKTTAVSILRNEPIAVAKLGERATQIVVPDGLCAVCIPADDVQAVGGALVPGMTVDVYAVGASGVSLVAQDVLILETSNGFGTATTSTGSGSSSLFGGSSSRAALKWVTVAVDERTVQEILSAARDRNLCLVLPGSDVQRALEEPNDGVEDDDEDESPDDWPVLDLPAEEPADADEEGQDEATRRAS